MNPERWRHIKEAFSAALELPPEERAEWLDVTLPDDPSLAREVRSLLAAHDGAGDFYERGALAAIPEVRRQLEGAIEGMCIGSYRVLSELGHGGMGAVYLAVRDEPSFTQKVALKLIKRGMDTDEIVRRFVAERQILASLAHPNIARLFDGGSTPDGRPYFVMEYVEGRPITIYADEQKLSIEARLRLFLRVCRAVQHAHQSLVVHRDLKPANILVDAEGEPKLLDFGIAKLLDPSSFGGMTASYALWAVGQERNRVEAQRQRVQALNDFLQSLLKRASPEQTRGRPLTIRQVLDAGARELLVMDARHDAATWAALLETTGSTYTDLGLYDEASRYLKQALALRERQRDRSREAALDTAGNWTLLGDLAYAQEKYGASRVCYQRAIAIKERFLGPAALPLVKDWNGLGMIALGVGIRPRPAATSTRRSPSAARRKTARKSWPTLATTLEPWPSGRASSTARRSSSSPPCVISARLSEKTIRKRYG